MLDISRQRHHATAHPRSLPHWRQAQSRHKTNYSETRARVKPLPIASSKVYESSLLFQHQEEVGPAYCVVYHILFLAGEVRGGLPPTLPPQNIVQYAQYLHYLDICTVKTH